MLPSEAWLLQVSDVWLFPIVPLLEDGAPGKNKQDWEIRFLQKQFP